VCEGKNNEIEEADLLIVPKEWGKLKFFDS